MLHQTRAQRHTPKWSGWNQHTRTLLTELQSPQGSARRAHLCAMQLQPMWGRRVHFRALSRWLATWCCLSAGSSAKTEGQVLTSTWTSAHFWWPSSTGRRQRPTIASLLAWEGCLRDTLPQSPARPLLLLPTCPEPDKETVSPLLSVLRARSKSLHKKHVGEVKWCCLHLWNKIRHGIQLS